MFNEATLFGQECWTAAELAEVLLLSIQRVGQLTKMGVLPRPRNGRYQAKEAVAAYIQYLQQSKRGEEQEKEEVEKLRLDNALKRLKLERASGEVMSKEAVKQAWFAAGRQVRDTLENLPDRLAGPLAAETDQPAVFALLSNELHQLLETLSKAPDVKAQKVSAAV